MASPNISNRQPREALLKKVLSDLDQLNAEPGKSIEKAAESWNLLGLIRLHLQQNMPEAKFCFEQALRFLENSDRIAFAITLSDLGWCHERLQENEKALLLYSKANTILANEGYSESHPTSISLERALRRLRRR